jgi:beta-phosphoglucomutase family hydrolase
MRTNSPRARIAQPMIRGVIFDLDGVVADSHPLHEEAWRVLLSEKGLDLPVDLSFIYSGLSRREILKHYLGPLSHAECEKLGRRKDELFSSLMHRIRVQPGLLRVLDQLRAAGIPLALATSASRARAYEILGKLGITDRFVAIVTDHDVSEPKPAPEAFLEAASRLGVSPQEAAVIEDSVAGVQAARAADMICIGYAPGSQVQALRDAGASDVISDFPDDIVTYLQHVTDSVLIPQKRD